MIHTRERGSVIPDMEVFRNDRLALIDADSILYFCCKRDCSFDEVKQRLDDLMFSILKDTGCGRYAAFMSDPQSFRKKLGFVRTYKGNRTGKETPELLYALKKYAEREWRFYTVENFEADDCVSLHREKGVICSPDKDVLRQIEGYHWNYQKNTWILTPKSLADHFLWLQTASGDPVDGVPGIAGIGAKKAESALEFLNGEDMPLKVLQMYISVYGPTEGMKAAVDRFKETLDLVYLLRTEEDLRRLGLEMPPLHAVHVLEILGEKWDTAPQ
jgi:hypothetical protein